MQVYVNEKRLISVRRTAVERLAKCHREGLCVACLAQIKTNERSIRGMHIRCYFATIRAIKSGKTTEDERIKSGKMLERQAGGRKPSNPVTAEFE